MKKLLFIIVFFISICSYSQEEQWKNPNYHKVVLNNTDIYRIDSAEIIEESIELKDFSGYKIVDYQWNADSQEIKLPRPTNFILEYYTYPKKLGITWVAKDGSYIVSRSEKPKYYEYSEGLSSTKSEIFENILAEGSLVRGISFGNNQGAAVQSSLNMNLEGKLSEKLNIVGHLSDYNIPIEQDGYSQQINEFENIYLGITSDNTGIYAGFLTLNPQDTYFANYNKKVTGVQFNTKFEHKNNSSTRISATGSITRGEYFRYRFIALEGNQGPYQLRGKYNETFIVIIPRSERIYLNGELLESGPDKDYTINYNTGEIIFTKSRLISQNQRITAEFQYTALSYNRFLWTGSAAYTSNKFDIKASIYSENDAKNSPTQQDLSQEDVGILQNAGNDTSQMFAPSFNVSEFDENKILYKKIEDINGDFIFEYSSDPSETLYVVNFTYVGENEGNYIKSESTTNGRIFVFVPPINGVPQGTHQPVKRLIAPESKQVFSLDSSYKIKNGNLIVNAAYSNDDKNTFSSIDDEDNGGYAIHTKINKTFQLSDWNITPAAEYNFINKNFYIIDRINKVEFYRDFDVEREFENIDQQQLNFQLGVNRKSLNFNYKYDFLDRKMNYRGSSQFINFLYKPLSYIFQLDALLNNNTVNQENSSVNQLTAKAGKDIQKYYVELGTEVRLQDQFLPIEIDREKQDYQKYYFLSSYTDSIRLQLKTEIYSSKADTINSFKNIKANAFGGIISSHWKMSEYSELISSLHLRTVDNIYQLQNTSIRDNNLLSDILWNQRIWKESIAWSLQYALESGNTPQREFQYVEVSDGNGIYRWTDYNENGIQEIDEFEIAEFQDIANYVRVYTSTLSYLKTAKNKLQFAVSFTPSKVWNTEMAKRWRFNSSFRTESSFPKENEIAIFDPFDTKDLLYNNKSIVSEVRFNSLSTHKWEAYYKYLLINNFRNNYLGKESLDKWSQQANLNLKLNENFIWENLAQINHYKSFSENLQNKNYFIKGFKVQPALEYRSSQQWRGKAYYSYQNKKNQYQLQHLSSHEFGASLEYQKNKTNLLSRLSYISNDFEGDSFSLVANQMLEGLKAGENWVWSLNLQRELASFIYLDINYEGRKNEQQKAIHIGNVQVKFVF